MNKTYKHNLVTYLNWTPIFKWYIVIWCDFENKSMNKMCLKRLGFCAPYMIIMPIVRNVAYGLLDLDWLIISLYSHVSCPRRFGLVIK